MTGPIHICGAEPGDTVKVRGGAWGLVHECDTCNHDAGGLEYVDACRSRGHGQGVGVALNARGFALMPPSPTLAAQPLSPPRSPLLPSAHQIEILDLYPRINPKTGRTYGSQAATRWGYQFRTKYATGFDREVVTIYE